MLERWKISEHLRLIRDGFRTVRRMDIDTVAEVPNCVGCCESDRRNSPAHIARVAAVTAIDAGFTVNMGN